MNVGKPNTNIWMWNGCLLVICSFDLPQNILMENMFYIIQMWERNGTISK